MENFVIKEKFTNLYFTVDGNRENLYREIPCSKIFWNEGSIQVETQVLKNNFHIPIFER